MSLQLAIVFEQLGLRWEIMGPWDWDEMKLGVVRGRLQLLSVGLRGVLELRKVRLRVKRGVVVDYLNQAWQVQRFLKTVNKYILFERRW